MAWTMRQRWTRPFTCARRTRRRARRRWAAFCAPGRARPRGFCVGRSPSTCGRVTARTPRAWRHRLPAGRGDGGPSALRFSWGLPTEGARRKRSVRAAWLSRTCSPVGHVFWPRSPRVCSVGSWGRARRRALPSGPHGGRRALAPLSAPPWLPRRPQRSPGARPLPSRSEAGPPPAGAASCGGPPRGRASPAGLCAGLSRTAALGRLGGGRASGRPGYTTAGPRGSARDRACRSCPAGRGAASQRGARGPSGLGRPPQRAGRTAHTRSR